MVIVPESATILFGGGFPRIADGEARRAAQTAIFHVQRNLEDVQAARYTNRVLLCDRGTVDGAAYWPDKDLDFFHAMGTTREAELARYDAVLFFESAAAGNLEIEGGNPVRTESNAEALEIDRKLHQLWSAHPHFHHVPHKSSFFEKIGLGLSLLQRVVEDGC